MSDSPPNERLVEHYLKQIQEGRPLKMPFVVHLPDGSFASLPEDDRARMEAAKRAGVKTAKCYVIEDDGSGETAAKIGVLREELEEDRRKGEEEEKEKQR